MTLADWIAICFIASLLVSLGLRFVQDTCHRVVTVGLCFITIGILANIVSATMLVGLIS